MKMTNWLKKLIPVLVLLFVMHGTVEAQTRIATVDLRKLFDGYYKTKQADAALKEREADLKKELASLREGHKKLVDDYQQLLLDVNDQAVSAEERDKRKRTAEARLKGLKENEDVIKQFVSQADASLAEQRRRMRENILEVIRTAVTARAKSAGYALVLDSAAETPNLTPVVVYNGGENDITSDVLAQLNADAPKESTSPPQK
ncbi:MAG: OmpH family outer membrane protein [Verrucomicrobia bacterium]|nr:OmpH family outer membrane protein [Verrucomicrobiota bacterium]